ncbi:MAG: Ig-like domain-containing protein [Mogibacterium sp.]|nr:Ig-like domain-containing protein [Mogibacterium sp.]
MRKGLSTLFLICVIILAGTLAVYAEENQGLTVYNTRFITNNKDATFIEGDVPVANGQTIVLKAGFHVIAEKQMPNTGKASSFRIKVPEESIRDNNVSVFYASERKGGISQSKPVRVEVEYIERQKQKITTDDNVFSMTYPGLDTSIKAKATSGEKLIYTSSNPDVVEVDQKGNLKAKSGGNAEISVRQIGSSAYEEAEKTVKVSVEEIDAYTVTFHSSDDENATVKQIIEMDSPGELQACSFENGDHKFLGWATEDGGLREFRDSESVTNLAEKGENADLYAVWTGDGAVAAVAWAIDIAADDSFAYGAKPAANAIGCYFCGTNCGPVKYNKPKGYEKTYVCLTFVAAAYAHGAEDPEVYYACSNGKMPLYENNNNFSRFSCWSKVGQCSNLSIDDLEPGDVVIQWSDRNDNSGHTWMYAGNGQIVESTGGGWGANSIALKDGAAGRLASYGRSGRNYVMRYVGANAQN